MPHNNTPPIRESIVWQDEKNGITTDRSLEIACYPGNSTAFIVITGRDGTIDGYKCKYTRIAERINGKFGATVFIANNPSCSWKTANLDGNFRRTLEYAENRMRGYFADDYRIYIMGHSAGAMFASWFAWEYPKICKLLLINSPLTIDLHKTQRGLGKFQGAAVLVYGAKDPSAQFVGLLEDIPSSKISLFIIDQADHDFSGEMLDLFMNFPDQYLFASE